MATLAEVQAKARSVIGANSAGPVDKFRLLELLDLLLGGGAAGEGLAFQSTFNAIATPGTPVTSGGFVRVATAVDANAWITLPPAKAGMEIWGWSVPAHEIRSFLGDTINAVLADGTTNEVAIPATTLWLLKAVSDGAWVLLAWSELGVVITALVPDAV